MKKLKAAFYTFYKSLTSPAYYKDLLEVNFAFSVKYFLVLAFIAFIITTPAIWEPLKNDFNKDVDRFVERAGEYFPEGLEITIQDGTIDINQPEPYIVPVPEESREEDYPANLIVVDSDGTLDDLETYDTVILINKSNILVQQSNNIEVYPLENLPNTTITHDDFINTLNKAKPYLKALPYIIIPIVLVVSGLIYFGSRIVYLAVVAFLLWIFAKIMGASTELGLDYKNSYKIAIHSMTLPLLIEVISDVASFAINAPLWFLLINVVFGMTAIYYIARDKAN